jgi:hypothetical protein
LVSLPSPYSGGACESAWPRGPFSLEGRAMQTEVKLSGRSVRILRRFKRARRWDSNERAANDLLRDREALAKALEDAQEGLSQWVYRHRTLLTLLRRRRPEGVSWGYIEHLLESCVDPDRLRPHKARAE